MNIEVKILRNEQSKPAGLLADAEIHFLDGELAGLKLVGFAIWERRDGHGRRVTFPGRPLIVHGDKRSFELLRAIGKPSRSEPRKAASRRLIRLSGRCRRIDARRRNEKCALVTATKETGSLVQ